MNHLIPLSRPGSAFALDPNTLLARIFVRVLIHVEEAKTQKTNPPS
ncbi:MAG: hypothetical protein HZB26_25940 [Candidatus Hydrogenedentes bacterium]|nr:hypothetical protein [Candidatus Hydrogenedentota bacterium]